LRFDLCVLHGIFNSGNKGMMLMTMYSGTERYEIQLCRWMKCTHIGGRKDKGSNEGESPTQEKG